MNKYILRTSVFWMVLFATVAVVFVYRSRAVKTTATVPAEVQPIASGPDPIASMNSDTSKDESKSASKMDVPLVPMQLSSEQINSIGVKSGSVEYKQLNDEIRATGTVDIDERLQSSVQVRFSGYIRKVFANATYQYIRKGDPLFTIYSPDLVATQEEYLLARRNLTALGGSSIDGVASGASSLTLAAEQRLRQWDIPEIEITKLKESGKAISELTINSPSSGYITERVVLPNMYVEPSTRLYTLADLSRVWVSAQVFQNDVGRLKRGDKAAIAVDAYPGRVFHGNVEEILPQVDITTRTVKVRLAVNNSGLTLKPGMFVNVDLKSALGRQLVVPTSAVFETGTRQVVFVDHGNGSIEPKDVNLGARVGEDFIVLKGVAVHERIVTSANFLLDSESQLQAATAPNSASVLVGAQSVPAQPIARQPSLVIDFATNPNPVHKGSNAITVKVKGVNGQPLVGAQVMATFLLPAMPAMGMGAVTSSFQLTQKSPGVYDGPFVLESGGTWQVTLTVKQGTQVLGTKQFRVSAEGGM